MQFENRINPRKTAQTLGIVSLYLAAQSLIGEYLLEDVLNGEVSSAITLVIDLFSVNLEESIPTWYSTMLLFICAASLAFIAAIKHKNKAPYARHWIGLATVFLYLSMDEGAAIHEIFVDPLQTAFNTTGYLTFAWQIVFVPLVTIFAIVYLRFLFHLPPRIRNTVILAGILYVGGAVIIEAISANRWYLDGGVSFPYLAIATIEELCEMLGAVLFLFALLSYASKEGYTAVTHFPLTTKSTAQEFAHQQKLSPIWKWGLKLSIGTIIIFNTSLGIWAYRQQSALALNNSSSAAFYEEVSERYAGQGVIILQINEAMTPHNPVAQPYAFSLLTLFNDILIVTLPDEQSSIAFVSHALPFDQTVLSQLLEQGDDNTQFLILDTTAVREIAEQSQ